MRDAGSYNICQDEARLRGLRDAAHSHSSWCGKRSATAEANCASFDRQTGGGRRWGSSPHLRLSRRRNREGCRGCPWHRCRHCHWTCVNTADDVSVTAAAPLLSLPHLHDRPNIGLKLAGRLRRLRRLLNGIAPKQKINRFGTGFPDVGQQTFDLGIECFLDRRLSNRG